MIKLDKISKVYKTKYTQTDALKNINLEINDGEFVSVIGKSGCGKTTLLNILGCMDSMTDGKYLFNDVDVTTYNDKQLSNFRNSQIGFVFQNYNLINNINVLENVTTPLGIMGVHKNERKKKALDLLKIVELEDKLKNYPTQLSGGQQQRIAIARAISNNAKVLLCDEPTGNLDEQSGKIVMDTLIKLNKEKKVTIVMVTHDMALAQLANRIIYIKDGEIIEK